MTHKLKVSTERGEILLDGKNIAGDLLSCVINMRSANLAHVTLTLPADVDFDAVCEVSGGK